MVSDGADYGAVGVGGCFLTLNVGQLKIALHGKMLSVGNQMQRDMFAVTIVAAHPDSLWAVYN